MTLDLNVEESPMKVGGVSTLSMKPSFLTSKAWWFFFLFYGVLFMTLSLNVCLLVEAAFITEVLILNTHEGMV